LYLANRNYPEFVDVYSFGDISKELCGGPHIKNTKEIGQFKIKKEEAVARGVRRIRGIII
jgi:alanyl-tRNA synthetase